jgi:hypothetical protein
MTAVASLTSHWSLQWKLLSISHVLLHHARSIITVVIYAGSGGVTYYCQFH